MGRQLAATSPSNTCSLLIDQAGAFRVATPRDISGLSDEDRVKLTLMARAIERFLNQN
jgi:hypothetical protein